MVMKAQSPHAGHHHDAGPGSSRTWRDYLPLLALIFVSVLVASALKLSYGAGVHPVRWMHGFMGFFLAAFALPVALLLAMLATPNVAWLFAATSLGYFLNYEFLHLAYHLPPAHRLARSKLIGRLKRLHEAHHDPQLMTRYNFNITYPLGDWLFGTRYKP